MVFRTGIPSINDRVALSAAQFKQNYREMQRYFARDHVPLNDSDANKRGFHAKVTFPNQGGDPTTAAGVIALYANGSSPTELFTRNESDGDITKVYSNGYAVNGLALEAWVSFDRDGNILKVKRTTVDADGQEQEVEESISSSNVSVVASGTSPILYTLTFDPALSTANYFPVIQARPGYGHLAQIQMQNDGTYSNTATTTTLKLQGYQTRNVTPTGASRELFDRINVQIYTVG